jgi:dienelactone hydrolase
MKKLQNTLLLLLCFSMLSFATEKKIITHDDYDKWELISDPLVSGDGSHAMYLLNPQRGDGHLIIHDLRNGKDVKIARGANAAFSPASGFAIFNIEPQRDVVRKAKVEKRRANQMPKDSIGIYVFGTGEILKYEDIRSYQLPKSATSNWVAFSINARRAVQPQQTAQPQLASLVDSVSMALPAPVEVPAAEIKLESLKQLMIMNPVTGDSYSFDNVESFRMAENGLTVVFLQDTPRSGGRKAAPRLCAFDMTTQSCIALDTTAGHYKYITISKDGQTYAWLHAADTSDDAPYSLNVYQKGKSLKKQMVNENHPDMPKGQRISEFRSLLFSDDHTRIFFGIAPQPESTTRDTLLAEEKYSVDIWHWQDAQLQPQQKIGAKKKREESFETVYHISSGKMIPLATEKAPGVVIDRFGTSPVMLAFSDANYQREASWLGRIARDINIVDVNTGQHNTIIQRAEASAVQSLYGNYILFYDPSEGHWFSHDIKAGVKRNLTAELGVSVYDETNDQPAFASPYGFGGWANNDAYLLIYDRYDVWKIDPSGKKKAENITGGYGRKNKIVLRYQNIEQLNVHVSDDQIWLSAFNSVNKQSGYYRLNMKNNALTQLIMEDASIFSLRKARHGNTLIWRRSTFKEYEDVWTSDLNFNNRRKISAANAFQHEYAWGSVELVEWSDFNNNPLQGLLYLPENFDPQKKYPMIVYFYEKTSDELHVHTIPSPSRSTINPTYCTSNGYIVFMPDIVYTTGYPGQSAYNAIISGTNAMTERYPFIDRERMALQGQSWGGYQIAYLITKTNMFKAAMAGAPVSNMVSAYGAIRWETGVVRQFQYEQAQSRIGATLWEKPTHYIENSPIFYTPDIETPLLIMANDNDGSVPWHQSIELFTAMRRLDKPVWMLVYNGEGHNLSEWPARMDLSVRMHQFFDHYLKDKPAPVWVEQGLPFVKKGIDNGYRLVQ